VSRAGKLARRSKEALCGHGVAATLLLALCLGGMVEIGRGLYIPTKAAVAQELLDHAFEASLVDHRPRRPWPWADTAPVARLSVARLGVTRIVLGGGSGQALAFGPTLLPAGAMPGHAGTAVIAAHRDTHFRFLHDMRTGDFVTLQTREGTLLRYRVTGTSIVRWDRYAPPDDTMGERLDLATCYPFDAIRSGPWRYVVHTESL
jgi:sortase A